MQRCPALATPPTPISHFACLNDTTRRLDLPNKWGDPSRRQVPLFVRWELYVGEYLRDLRRVLVVQAGANCGKNTYGCANGGDPVWEYATACGWRGVLLEPVSYVFSSLCRNYARWPRITPLRAAVTNETGNISMLVGKGEMNHMLSRAEEAKANPRRRNETVGAVTLRDVWAAAAPGISEPSDDIILVVDVEGAEGRVLAGGQSLPSPLPRLVLFEVSHLPHAETRAIHRSLERQGFELVASLRHNDPVGRRSPPADRLYGRRLKPRKSTSKPIYDNDDCDCEEGDARGQKSPAKGKG